jgi:predicted dehydrogenase
LKIGVGVVGLGIMGERLLNVLKDHPETEIRAICDVDSGKIHTVQNYLGDVFTTTDYKELVTRNDIDLVYIAVPPAYHFEVVIDAIRANKHILCEKPLAATIEQAKEMMQLAQEAGIVHAMNFPTYYTELYKTFRNMLEDGFLGTLRKIELRTYFQNWPRSWQPTPWLNGREQGGFVREVWPHFLHIIHSTWGKIEYRSSYVEYPSDPNLCETGVTAFMQLEDGTPIVASGSSQTAFPNEESVILTCIGSNGTLSIENWSDLRACQAGQPWETLVTRNTSDRARHLSDLITNVASAIRGEAADLVSFQTGYEIQVILDTIRAGKEE